MSVVETKLTYLRNDEYSSKIVELFRGYMQLNEKFDVATAMSNAHGLVTFIDMVFKSRTYSEVFLYLCARGASTALVLQGELSLTETAVYRVLKRLRNLNIIEPALKIKKHKDSQGGPRPSVWALVGASSDEVARAIRLHEQMLSPKFRIAYDIAQTIIKDYITPRNVEEINMSEIFVIIKESRIPFKGGDIAELTARYLDENGIKVWR